MKRFFEYRYWFIAILIVAYYAFFNTFSADSALPQEQSLTINAIVIPHRDVEIKKQYVGYVVPIQQADMSANVNGYIDEVLVKGGEKVKVGDNLMLIDQRIYKAEWEAAKAAKTKAKADYDNARTYYNRVRKAGKQAFSAAELDNAKAAYLSAQAALQQAEAAENKAKTAFDYTIIQAPIDGIIGNIDLTKGNYITPNSKLFSIVQFDPIRVVFAIPDKDFMLLDNETLKSNQIKLQLANGNIYEYSGEYKYSDNQINRATNSMSLYADFANPEKKLLANSYVDVLVLKNVKNAALIRQNYAQIKDDGIWVYVIKDKRLKQVKLQIDGIVDNFYAAGNNFAKDEYLVTDKIGQLSPQTRLKVHLKEESEK